jgi:hypothetical protein
MAILALQNLIDAAGEARPPAGCPEDGRSPPAG